MNHLLQEGRKENELAGTQKKEASTTKDATYGGIITANDVTITTSGAHCAPLATDRGGGTVKVSGTSTLTSTGQGSPIIYSTGTIDVTRGTGTATGSEAIVIEGKNSVTVTDSSLTGKAENGIMMYQSTSGYANDKDASSTHSTLTLTNSTITSEANGSMIYITNTRAIINATSTKFVNNTSTDFINAASGNWGTSGSNGGTLTFTADAQTLKGNITADSLSSISINLTNKSSYTGATTGTVNITADSTSSKNST